MIGLNTSRPCRPAGPNPRPLGLCQYVLGHRCYHGCLWQSDYRSARSATYLLSLAFSLPTYVTGGRLLADLGIQQSPLSPTRRRLDPDSMSALPKTRSARDWLGRLVHWACRRRSKTLGVGGREHFPRRWLIAAAGPPHQDGPPTISRNTLNR
jgi:hypothetical protein